MFIILSGILFLAALIGWIILVAAATTLHRSDLAGNGLVAAYAGLEAVGLWLLLAVLLVIAASRGAMPAWAIAAALLLVPASGVAAQKAIGTLSANSGARWPLIVPAAAPPLILAYLAWCMVPSLHSTIGPAAAAGSTWGLILVLAPLPWVAGQSRQRKAVPIPIRTPAQITADETLQREALRRERRARFHTLTPDSPFKEWWAFADTDGEFRQEALDGARRTNDRRKQVVAMLGTGRRDVFLALPRLDLEAAGEIDQAVRIFLIDQVRHLRPYDPAAPLPASIVTEWLEPYFPTIQWLVEHGLGCNAELSEMAAAVRRYPDSPERRAFLQTLESLRTA